MHSDWLKIVMWLWTTNQIALFKHIYATLKFVYNISSCFHFVGLICCRKFVKKVLSFWRESLQCDAAAIATLSVLDSLHKIKFRGKSLTRDPLSHSLSLPCYSHQHKYFPRVLSLSLFLTVLCSSRLPPVLLLGLFTDSFPLTRIPFISLSLSFTLSLSFFLSLSF